MLMGEGGQFAADKHAVIVEVRRFEDHALGAAKLVCIHNAVIAGEHVKPSARDRFDACLLAR